MKLRRVDPRTIEWPEVRVTAQFDEELYRQFKESIKAVGQIAPIICYQVDEKLVGCDGKHRCDEALAAGGQTVDVVVIPGDMVDVLTKNIFLDHLRGKTPVSQMVRVIGTLYADYNLDPVSDTGAQPRPCSPHSDIPVAGACRPGVLSVVPQPAPQSHVAPRQSAHAAL
ncbi:hypothetical protein ES708_05176 [subsurface metagenome]